MVAAAFEEHRAVLDASVDALVPALEAAVATAVASVRAGGRILVAGNGGSAAQAQHFAAELCGRFEADRPAVSAIALTADVATLTAVGNDLGFEQAFARQVAAHARPGDVLVAISTSGRSPNVLAAARTARSLGCGVVALTGAAAAPLHELADVCIQVASDRTCRVQEIHTICLHVLAAGVEDAVVAAGAPAPALGS